MRKTIIRIKTILMNQYNIRNKNSQFKLEKIKKKIYTKKKD